MTPLSQVIISQQYCKTKPQSQKMDILIVMNSFYYFFSGHFAILHAYYDSMVELSENNPLHSKYCCISTVVILSDAIKLNCICCPVLRCTDFNLLYYIHLSLLMSAATHLLWLLWGLFALLTLGKCNWI